ncbi:hypothetical protein CV016_20375 [Yersinia kristensenii]|uniref:Uncharacterized protein n=1 Tax=Yersinia kristensenii TaxID=28152 RepID=A0AB73QBY8_YERKR|nr:hypothetical protein CBW52_11530 [Yersinia kristensenii]PHZ34120.1 hypothetical protein CS536_20035 [Yersinia kristensenii]PJE82994.1 hypothetical protein CU276_14700 [Yersinia kristensenii]PJG60920.1 hypothetical protein CV016_20375 [Yersinia kristensenii]
MGLGSAQNPHVLCVRSGSCALAAPKLSATITPTKLNLLTPYRNCDHENEETGYIDLCCCIERYRKC